MTDPIDTSSELNPYRSPIPVEEELQTDLAEVGDPINQIEVAEMSAKKRPWTIGMYSDRLRFISPGETGLDVTRDEFPYVISIGASLFIRRSVSVKKNGKKVMFNFSVDNFKTLSEWTGPPTEVELRIVQRRGFVLFLAIALIFCLSSLPLDGDPVAGFDPVPFDFVAFGLGVFLAFTAIGSRLFPHRLFFLADCLWFASLAVSTTYGIVNGENWLQILIVLVGIQVAIHAIWQYRRFATMVRTDSVVGIA